MSIKSVDEANIQNGSSKSLLSLKLERQVVQGISWTELKTFVRENRSSLTGCTTGAVAQGMIKSMTASESFCNLYPGLFKPANMVLCHSWDDDFHNWQNRIIN